MANAIEQVKTKKGNYLVYKTGDSIKVIIIEKGTNTCLYEVTFIKDFSHPKKEILHSRDLTEMENKLFAIKNKLLKEVFTLKYNVTCTNGYNLNIELIPYESGYKLYIITGTSLSEVIPIGNDYIFFADKEGIITSWRKLHSRLIPLITKYKGQKVHGLVHTHFQSEPFISATDICTFKLYANLYGINQFDVLSTALSKYFTYLLDENKILVKDI